MTSPLTSIPDGDRRLRPGQPGPSRRRRSFDLPRPPVLDVVVPVHNEERVLEVNVRRLRRHLDRSLPFPAVITIADNANTDGTWGVATRLAASFLGVRALHLDQKGRGRALRAAWSASEAEVVAYMDVDLSTDLTCLAALVAPIASGQAEVVIGTRLVPEAHVVRGAKREVVSRVYNGIIRATMHSHFSDAQCGFKALRRTTAIGLLPLIEDQEWFFDTELLLRAEELGLAIGEVPVRWVDDPDSRVRLVATAVKDLQGLWRVRRELARVRRR